MVRYAARSAGRVGSTYAPGAAAARAARCPPAEAPASRTRVRVEVPGGGVDLDEADARSTSVSGTGNALTIEPSRAWARRGSRSTRPRSPRSTCASGRVGNRSAAPTDPAATVQVDDHREGPDADGGPVSDRGGKVDVEALFGQRPVRDTVDRRRNRCGRRSGRALSGWRFGRRRGARPRTRRSRRRPRSRSRLRWRVCPLARLLHCGAACRPPPVGLRWPGPVPLGTVRKEVCGPSTPLPQRFRGHDGSVADDLQTPAGTLTE